MVSEAMDPAYWETEFVKLVRRHFAFLRDLGYAEPILEREESAFFVSWIDLTYLAPSRDRSCCVSLFLKPNEGSIQLSLTRNEYRTLDDYLDFKMYMEKRVGTSLPKTFRLSGGTESELVGAFEEVVRLNAQALRESGRALIDGSTWEAGYYHRKD